MARVGAVLNDSDRPQLLTNCVKAKEELAQIGAVNAVHAVTPQNAALQAAYGAGRVAREEAYLRDARLGDARHRVPRLVRRIAEVKLDVLKEAPRQGKGKLIAKGTDVEGAVVGVSAQIVAVAVCGTIIIRRLFI